MKTEDYRSIAKELLQIFFKYNRIKYFKSTLNTSDLKRFEELELKLAGSGVCMLCGVPKERHGTCCGEKNAVQIEKVESLQSSPQEKEETPDYKQLIDLLKSDSVYWLLRYGVKSPSQTGMDNCDDSGYYDLYNIVCKLREGKH